MQCRCPGPHEDTVKAGPCCCPGDKVELRVDLNKPPLGRRHFFCHCDTPTRPEVACPCDVKMRELREELNEADVLILALRAQRDGANNRVKYLENLILECFGKSGIKP